MAARQRSRARTRGATIAAITVAGAAAVASPGCRTATQVTLEIRTDGSLTCAEVKGVAIVVALTPAAAEGKMALSTLSAEIVRGACGPDRHLLGTLVMTPSDSTGAVVVRARVSDSVDSTCKPPDYRGCIVSRRAFSFIDHASVTLPITLELSCADVPCDAITSCRTGQCISSNATCFEETERCESPAEPVVTADGGAPLPDDAAVDGTLPDGAVADASNDADAKADTGDGAVGNPGEDCPTGVPGGEPCYSGVKPLCCANVPMQRFECTDNAGGCPGLYPRFSCTNTALCTGLCCAGTPDGGAITGTCTGTFASCPAGQRALCKTSLDCPIAARSCTFPVYTLGGKTIFGCQ